MTATADSLALIVLSPHLDDAALSCGGTIFRTARAGGRVRVVTAFAGDEPPEPPSQLVRDLLRWWRLPAGEAMATRRHEDGEALAALGAELEHWALPEAPYRLEAAGGPPRYGTLEALFAEVDLGSREAELLADLAARLRRLPAAARVLVPLGVGGHVDHRLLRLAAESALPAPLEYYEEYPYAQWRWSAVARLTRPRRAWTAESEALDGDALTARCRAVACYRSQIAGLFGSVERLERRLRRYVRRVGGERTWRRAPGARGGSS